ncbi:methionyl-tRNA formyltransferase [Luteolibacter ambystomatis]|uniref:Methionyl-tRNA formyltransferase n=1 Tax=Luteolibacter ambystomatis TaxID=2824561 RepID=A0A975PGC7_9BACT|nr:methionyl-tRNA formyltransferase [Luteolibacter ambystomatis]QUE52182.1 methionyl-tRNA formyltransferase [Luteolibacter ambystomatis]
MRIAFFGTGEIAIPAFRRLIEAGPAPVLLVTQPDKPVGRHHTLTPPAIKTVALEAGIPVLQPEKVRNAIEELAAYDIDLMVVMAYGQILPLKLIKLPRIACINLHASLLPRYRGAACIQAAIDSGDEETGITVMHVVKQLDAGDIILAKSIPILPGETGGHLHDRLAGVAADAMADALQPLAAGTASRTPQDENLVSYIPKLEREDGRLDFTKTANELERRIRAYDPWPGTYVVIREDGKERRLKIFPPVEVVEGTPGTGEIDTSSGSLLIGCGEDVLKLLEVQPEGARRMNVSDYLRGRKPERIIPD